MQYLSNKRIGQWTVTYHCSLPYRVNALLEKNGLCTIGNKFFHLQESVDTTSFETLRIMKDEFVVAPENEFVLNVVHPALGRVD